MAITQADLDGFRRFAQSRIARGGAESLQALVAEWDLSARTARDHRIGQRQWLTDIGAGRTRAACDVLSELRQRLDAE